MKLIDLINRGEFEKYGVYNKSLVITKIMFNFVV